MKIRKNNLLEATEFYLTDYFETNIGRNLKFEEVILEVVENKNRHLLSFLSQNQTYFFKGIAAFKNIDLAKSSSDAILKYVEMSFTTDKTYYLSLLTKSGMQVSDVAFKWITFKNDTPKVENNENNSYSLFLIIAAVAAFLAVATILIVWTTSRYYKKKRTDKLPQQEKNEYQYEDVVKTNHYNKENREPTAKLALEKIRDATPVKKEIQLDSNSVVSELTFGTQWRPNHKPSVQQLKTPSVITEVNSVETTDKTEKDHETGKKSDMVSVCSYHYSLPDGIDPSINGGCGAKKNLVPKKEQLATINAMDDEDLFLSTYSDDYP